MVSATTIHPPVMPVPLSKLPGASSHSSKAKRERFLSVFPRIRDELLQHLEAGFMPPDVNSWFKHNLEYNVPGGKLNRGMSVIDTVEIIRGRELVHPEEYFEAALLGWGVELLQSFFLVVDDIMDGSVTRRGQQCWYRCQQPSAVGMIAINDALMLESSIFYLIKRHFRGRPYYADLVELFHDMTFVTEQGQLVDLITAPEDSVDLARFSLSKHRLIVVYKTAYYSFYLPVALAMLYAGIPVPKQLPTVAGTISVCMNGTRAAAAPAAISAMFNGHANGHVEPPATQNGHANGHVVPSATQMNGAGSLEPFQLALDILIPLGEYFQVQDDYLDCFGNDIGKVGTDILDNKCSWVVCTALELASPEQRAILDANYGRKDGVCEARCKDIFEELGLRERYATYEETAYKRINALIDCVDESVLEDGQASMKKEIFRSFLSKIYRRQK